MNSLTFWLNSAPDDAAFCHTASSGNKPATIWELQTRNGVTISPSQHKFMRCDSFIAVRIVARNFRAFAACVARLHVSLVVENTTAANSMRDFVYD
jgi:hypothetical protein